MLSELLLVRQRNINKDTILQMKMKNIKAFDRAFDIEVTRKGKAEIVNIKTDKGTITKKWDGNKVLEIILP